MTAVYDELQNSRKEVTRNKKKARDKKKTPRGMSYPEFKRGDKGSEIRC